MTPYYADDAVTIYHADCREIDAAADVLVTDPPYGVNLGQSDKRGGRFGLAKHAYSAYDDTYENFLELVPPVLRNQLALVKRGAVFSGPHLQDMPKADALGGIYLPSGSGRHSWGFKTFLPILFYGVAPGLQAGRGASPNVLRTTQQPGETNGHPCPKPLEWMRWLIALATLPGETVIDPFSGSGSTLRAAKDHGRKAIGIEIEESYCEIAATRCAQEVLPLEGAA